MTKAQEVIEKLKQLHYPDEEILDTFTVKLFNLVGNSFQPIGLAGAQILKGKSNGRSRLLFRDFNDMNKSLLNTYLLPFYNLQFKAPNIIFTAWNYDPPNPPKKLIYAITVKADRAESLYNLIQKCIEENKQLLAQKA